MLQQKAYGSTSGDIYCENTKLNPISIMRII